MADTIAALTGEHLDGTQVTSPLASSPTPSFDSARGDRRHDAADAVRQSLWRGSLHPIVAESSTLPGPTYRVHLRFPGRWVAFSSASGRLRPRPLPPGDVSPSASEARGGVGAARRRSRTRCRAAQMPPLMLVTLYACSSAGPITLPVLHGLGVIDPILELRSRAALMPPLPRLDTIGAKSWTSLFLERVGELGHISDTVHVRTAMRAILLPRGKALHATDADKKKFGPARRSRGAQSRTHARRQRGVGQARGPTVVIVRRPVRPGGSTARCRRTTSPRRSRHRHSVQRGHVAIQRPSRRSACTAPMHLRPRSR